MASRIAGAVGTAAGATGWALAGATDPAGCIVIAAAAGGSGAGAVGLAATAGGVAGAGCDGSGRTLAACTAMAACGTGAAAGCTTTVGSPAGFGRTTTCTGVSAGRGWLSRRVSTSSPALSWVSPCASVPVTSAGSVWPSRAASASRLAFTCASTAGGSGGGDRPGGQRTVRLMRPSLTDSR
jgi:hypothetical protein